MIIATIRASRTESHWMPVDSQLKAFLEEFAKFPPLHTLTPEVARSFTLPSPPGLAVEHVEDLLVRSPEGHDIPVRLYRPQSATLLPMVVFFHGGGWVLGSLDSHDSLCRCIAVQGACAVLSVDYRLAPEHKFPAAPDDALAVTRWAGANAELLEVDGRRIAVAGDSAGGNLAAVTCVRLRDEGGPRLVGQLLIYPAVRHFLPAIGSMVTNGSGYFLDLAAIEWFTGHYLSRESDQTHPHFAVALTPDLSNLPPALVITAEYDPLLDEGEDYAERLQAAGNRADRLRFNGMIHGFFGMAGIDRGGEAVDRATAWLREIFAGAAR
jgi:acetyl esterase